MKKSNNLGWQCPICKTVYSPYINICHNCSTRIYKPTIYANDIYNAVVDIIADKIGLSKKSISLHSSIDDLAIDSLDAVGLIMEFEKVFRIQIPNIDAERLYRVEDVVQYIISKIC
jgi:acyl carrier protein